MSAAEARTTDGRLRLAGLAVLPLLLLATPMLSTAGSSGRPTTRADDAPAVLAVDLEETLARLDSTVTALETQADRLAAQMREHEDPTQVARLEFRLWQVRRLLAALKRERDALVRHLRTLDRAAPDGDGNSPAGAGDR